MTQASSLASLARGLVLAVSLGTLLSAACASSDRAPCERNSDCDQAYCLEGSCRQDCVDSALDCPKGYSCSAIGKCEFDAAGGAAGSTSGGASGDAGTTSAAGQSGAGGQSAGASGSQGGAGAAGTSAGTAGTSAGPGGSGGSAGVSGTSGQAGTAGQAGESGQAGTDAFGGGAGVTGQGVELDACAGDSDCASGLLCRASYKNGPRGCTRPCAGNADCFGGRRCETIDGTKVCTTGDVGRGCSSPDTCNFGCLLGPKYCTTECATGADCPNGFGCSPVGSPATRVCVKLAAACDSQDTSDCLVPAACDTSSTLIVSGCTAACTSAADCPQRAAGLPAWTCDGACRRPADVHGPLAGGTSPTQYACLGSSQVVNVCNDAQHLDFDAFTIPPAPAVDCSNPITTSGPPTDSCVDSCRFQGGCAWGFACTAVGGVSNARIGLCLPQGAKPVGASCAGGTECAFGYCLASGVCSRDCTADGLCPTGSTCTAAGGPAAEGMPFRRCM